MLRSLFAVVLIMAASMADAQSVLLDPTFGSEGIATLEVPFHGSDLKAMAVQPDGKIVAVGFIRMGSQNADLLLCRYNTNGTLDGSFGTAGLVRHNLYNEDAFWAVALQADGKIVAAGYTSSGNSMFMCAARFNTDGSFDNSFGSNGIAVLYPKNGLSRAWAIAVLPDGKVLLGGEIGPSMFDLDQVLVRLRADGYIDMSFGGDGWVSIGNGLIESVEAIVTQENGLIVTAGKGSTLNFGTSGMLARFDASGGLDPTFGTNGIAKFDLVAGIGDKVFRDLVLLPDQRMIATGYVSNGNNTQFLAARYNTFGVLDSTYGTNGFTLVSGPGEQSYANGSYLQSDGKLVLVGATDTDPLDRSSMFVRLTADGILDTSFDGDGVSVHDLGVQRDEELQQCAVLVNGDLVAVGGVEAQVTGRFEGVVVRLSTGWVGIGTNETVQLNAFPTIFTEHIRLSYEWPFGDLPNIQVFDALGKAVPCSRSYGQRGGSSITEQLTFGTDLAPGSYVVRIGSSTRTGLVRVVKE